MPASRKYDQETRDRAVRLYQERRRDHTSESAVESRRRVGELLDIKLETLRGWVPCPAPARSHSDVAGTPPPPLEVISMVDCKSLRKSRSLPGELATHSLSRTRANHD